VNWLNPEELTSDALTARVRVFQRKGGHRYSFDDVVTAWVAARELPEARTHLDLGCGIGSVLLMIADTLPSVRSVGIEAQDESFALAEHNVAHNALGERVTLVHGDLRDPTRLPEGVRFELVTGTPPYKKPGTATPSPDPQRAHARIELRGGIEDYLAAAARVLAPGGACVVCMEAAGAARVMAGAQTAGLSVHAQLDVIPIEDRKGRLFSVFTLRREPAELVAIDELALRDGSGARTQAALELRTFFGLENPQHELPSPSRRA
jgi:tRNA1Val (adenine37-N6)-methyltransferase